MIFSISYIFLLLPSFCLPPILKRSTLFFSRRSRYSKALMESEGLLPCSQKPVAYHCPGSVKLNSYTPEDDIKYHSSIYVYLSQFVLLFAGFRLIFSCVCMWLQTGFGLETRFIEHINTTRNSQVIIELSLISMLYKSLEHTLSLVSLLSLAVSGQQNITTAIFSFCVHVVAPWLILYI